MSRIFLALASLSVLLLLVNVILGFATGDVGGMWQDYEQEMRTFRELQLRPNVTQQEIKSEADRLAVDYRALTVASGRLRLHLLMGVLAALVTVLVNSIAVTYFIGTTRWCREVTEAYDLDQSLFAESNALKRKSFPWAVAGILLILIIIALGSMADPNVSGRASTNWRTPHYMVALFATAFIAWSFFVQLNNIAGNHAVINKLLDAVRQIRSDKGLDKLPRNEDG